MDGDANGFRRMGYGEWLSAVHHRAGADMCGEFLGRYPLSARLGAPGGAVHGDGSRSVVHHQWLTADGPGLVLAGADRYRGTVRVRGGYEYHQLHGRHQRHHSRVCSRGARAAIAG